MSKPASGLFRGTAGDTVSTLQHILALRGDEPTAVVWAHIKQTQPNYSGTLLPRSFEIDVPLTKETPDGKMWTHGNATEHIYEALTSIKEDPRLKGSNPSLYTQFILYDYYKTLGSAVSKGLDYAKTVRIGNWEFAFAKARSGASYPVVKHALFTGIEK